MRAQFQHFKLVATGPMAVSMSSMILYLPVSFVFALEREFALTPGSLNDQIRIVLAGEIASFIFLQVSAATLLRKRTHQAQNIYLCLLVWAMTGLVRGFATDFYASSILNYESHATNRILLSVIFSTLGLATAAYTFGYIFEIETKKAALRSLNTFISAENRSLNFEQIAMKKEAISTLQKTLVPRVLQLQTLTAGMKKIETSAALTRSLQSLEEQARRLAYQMRVNLDHLESIPKPRTSVTSRRLNSSRLSIKIWPSRLSITLSILFLLVGGVIVQFGRNSTEGALAALLGTFLIAIVLLFFGFSLQKLTWFEKRWLCSIAYLSVFVTQYFYASQLMPQIFELSQAFDPIYSAVKVTFAVFLASFFLSFIEADSGALKSMSDEIAFSRENLKSKGETNTTLASLNSSTKEGALQGKISGVLLALNMISDEEGSSKMNMDIAEVIDNAIKLLADSIAEIENANTRELLD